MAKLIKSSMEIQDVFPANGKDFKLAELKSFVGGYIEILNLNDRQIMVVSEEGKLMGLPRNRVASEAFYLARGIQETIVGDVLICNVEQVKQQRTWKRKLKQKCVQHAGANFR